MTTRHHTKAIMIQGTSSSVGKSVMAAALCRILAQNGVNVAPFKAQNMSNNSYVTADGGEMGRAQVVQAQAAGIEPHADMNPVLLKPEADSRSQVVINGKAVGSFEARKYWGDQSEAWTAVTEAYDRLAAQYDVIVLEGAGSPAEVNLRDRDIVNMRMAAYANASVILVGDIDRGGVFASLLGTMELLLPEERSLVKATLINRFRGDIELLNPLPEMIAERTGVPVAGIIPFLHDLQVKDEDGVTFGDYNPPAAAMAAPPPSFGRDRGWVDCDERPSRPTTPGVKEEGDCDAEPSHPMTNAANNAITIGVVGLPRISNHDDLDPFRRAGCRIRIVTKPSELASAQIIIIPGSKSTIADLRWMKSRGLDKAIIEAANNNVTIIGICGGYQILGEQLDDPNATESPKPESESGLGLLPISTTFDTTKTTRRVNVEIPTHESGPLKGDTATGTGYEIHTGITTGTESPLATLTNDHPRVPSAAEGSGADEVIPLPVEPNPPSPTTDFPSKAERTGADEVKPPSYAQNSQVEPTDLPPDSFSPREKARLRRNADPANITQNVTTEQRHPEPVEGRHEADFAQFRQYPDGATSQSLPIIGTYVHGIFDSPDILRRLLNTTAQTHDLPKPTIEEFSMEAEFDRLAQTVRENIDMNLINNLIKHPQ